MELDLENAAKGIKIKVPKDKHTNQKPKRIWRYVWLKCSVSKVFYSPLGHLHVKICGAKVCFILRMDPPRGLGGCVRVL